MLKISLIFISAIALVSCRNKADTLGEITAQVMKQGKGIDIEITPIDNDTQGAEVKKELRRF